MSGVAKDETNPTAPTGEVPTEGSAKVSDSIPAAETVETAAAETESKSARRSAAHLRVVTEADAAAFTTPETLAEAPHQRIGAVIRAQRENRGLTLEQVSKETKVTVSHLRAIEDMTPNIIGEAVYVKGHIRTYARHLGLNADDILTRYLKECAILKDPEKQEIAPPQVSRSLPVAVPVLGIVVIGLMGAAAFFFLSNDQPKKPAGKAGAAGTAVATAAAPAASSAATPEAGAPVRPALRIVALRRAMLEVRSSAGDKYVKRYFDQGESYLPRVGAGFTVSADDGTAFEWRIGDESLGPLSTEASPIYNQSVDLAAKRPPVNAPPAPLTAAAPAPAPAGTTPPAAAGATPAPATGAAGVAAATPAPPKPKAPVVPKPAAEAPPQAATPAPTSAVAPPTPANDPSLQAYPDH